MKLKLLLNAQAPRMCAFDLRISDELDLKRCTHLHGIKRKSRCPFCFFPKIAWFPFMCVYGDEDVYIYIYIYIQTNVSGWNLGGSCSKLNCHFDQI